jgi:hypothetical protein
MSAASPSHDHDRDRGASRFLRRLVRAPLWLVGAVIAALLGLIIVGVVLLLVVAGGKALARVPLLDVFAPVAAALLAVALCVCGRWLFPRLDRAGELLPPFTIAPRRPLAVRWALGAVLSLIVAGVMYALERVLHLAARNHPVGATVALGVAALGGFGLLLTVAPDRSAEWWCPDLRRVAVAPAVLILAAGALGVYGGYEDRQDGLLGNYCQYGAVSRSQLYGCLDHVTDDQINRLDTDAARFARGQLNSCLADAGPYCANALATRNDPQ